MLAYVILSDHAYSILSDQSHNFALANDTSNQAVKASEIHNPPIWASSHTAKTITNPPVPLHL